jgi:hypothetical protein
VDVPLSCCGFGISNTLEFLLSATRDAEAAKRFFSKTLAASHTTTPRVINVDKNAAYPKAFNELQAEGGIPDSCELRQVKYLNNIVEQDHRAHQTTRQSWVRLLLTGNSMEHAPGIRGDEHGQERANAWRGKRGHHGADRVHLQPVWSGSLS